MRKLIALAAGSIVALSAAQAAPTVWADNGHAYEFISGPVDYATASATAAASTYMGSTGHIVTITSAEELDFVNNTIVGSAIRFWLGMSDTETEGTFRWIQGPEAGLEVDSIFEAWAPGEPNDFSIGEDFAIGWWNGSGQWNDIRGTSSYAYVVEYSNISQAVPVPGAAIFMASGFGLAAFRKLRRSK